MLTHIRKGCGLSLFVGLLTSFAVPPMAEAQGTRFGDLRPEDVVSKVRNNAQALKEKEEELTDAYSGYEFIPTRRDFEKVNKILGMSPAASRALYRVLRDASNWRIASEQNWIPPKHPWAPALLILRDKHLATGLESMNDRSFPQFVTDNIQTIRRTTGILSFKNVYIPAEAFANAFAAFGADVSSDVLFRVAEQEGYEGTLGTRKDIRGDFGIALFLVTLAEAS